MTSASKPTPQATANIVRLPPDREPPEVDPAAAAVHEHRHGVVHALGDVEVARQEVARPHRDDPERDLRAGEGLHDLEHRAVTPDGDHHVHAALHGAGGPRRSWPLVVTRRAIDRPARRLQLPARLAHGLADLAARPPAPDDERPRHPGSPVRTRPSCRAPSRAARATQRQAGRARSSNPHPDRSIIVIVRLRCARAARCRSRPPRCSSWAWWGTWDAPAGRVLDNCGACRGAAAITVRPVDRVCPGRARAS